MGEGNLGQEETEAENDPRPKMQLHGHEFAVVNALGLVMVSDQEMRKVLGHGKGEDHS